MNPGARKIIMTFSKLLEQEISAELMPFSKPYTAFNAKGHKNYDATIYSVKIKKGNMEFQQYKFYNLYNPIIKFCVHFIKVVRKVNYSLQVNILSFTKAG